MERSGMDWDGLDGWRFVFFLLFFPSPFSFLRAFVCMYDVCVCALHAYVCVSDLI